MRACNNALVDRQSTPPELYTCVTRPLAAEPQAYTPDAHVSTSKFSQILASFFQIWPMVQQQWLRSDVLGAGAPPLRLKVKSRLAYTREGNCLSQSWDPDCSIELELQDWQSRGYDPATHLMQHAYVQHGLSYSDIELKAMQLMEEPMELELPAMLAYLSFPEEWFNECGLYHEQVRALDTITLAGDESVFAVKKAGAIAAKRMSIATHTTQNNLECCPDEIRQRLTWLRQPSLQS